jgi:hypothetical protein
MRRVAPYVPYAVALFALAILAWAIVHSTSRTPVNLPDATFGVSNPLRPEVPIPAANELLTADDLQTLTGDTYQPRNAQARIPTMTQCEFVGPYEITLTVVSGADAPLRYASSRQHPKQVPQPDLGDEAVWIPTIGVIAAMARQDQIALQVEVRELDRDTERDPESTDKRLVLARSIAAHVLDRLDEALP